MKRWLVFIAYVVLFGLAAVGARACATVRAQAPAPTAGETLTALEQKDVETWQLKRQLTQAYRQIADLQALVGTCQGQLGSYQAAQNGQALDAEEKMIVASFEKAHPGYTLDPKTGQTSKKAAPVATPPPKS